MMTRCAYFLASVGLMVSPVQASLSPAEATISKTVDTEFEKLVTLLETLVNQNSGSLNIKGVTRVGQMIREQLEPLGFIVEWKPMLQTGRAGHLIAVHRGKSGNKRLLLIGHLDSVFEADSPFQTFTRKGDDAEGPGAGDDKGGLVVMLAALRAMRAAGTLARANIEIVLTGDEEDSGEPLAIARADLIAAGKRADAALDFEGLFIENGRDMGSIARRSSNSWALTTTGKTGHSSLIFNGEYGDGAIFELSRIVARFRTELPEPNLTFNVGLIAGGASVLVSDNGTKAASFGKSNIIPGNGFARGDFRTLSDEQSARVRAKMTAIVDAHSPATDAKLVFEPGGYPAMAPTDGNRALLAKLNSVNADLGLATMEPLDPLKRGAGDISFVANDVSGLVGLGTASRGDHAPGETVSLTSIKRQAKRAAILMSRLARERR